MMEMPVEEKNSGRERRHCYLEVKVPEGSTGVSGYWTLDCFTWTDSNLTFQKC